MQYWDEIYCKIRYDVKYFRNQVIYVYGEKSSRFIDRISSQFNIQTISINIPICKNLIDVQKVQYSRYAANVVEDMLNQVQDEAVCIKNFEILFHPTLKTNPFILFDNISRNKILFVLWTGRVQNSMLIYGDIGHPEYKEYKINMQNIVEIQS